jgi:hypothetical protein
MRILPAMKATRYFTEQVLRKRPYLSIEWLGLPPVATEPQPDGRVRVWVRIEDAPPDGGTRFLRIVLLEDGETVHNAFFDRNFTPPAGGDAP